jgi:chaperonin GroES
LLESGEIRPLDVRPGDIVLYGKYAGTEVERDGEKLRIVGEDDCLAVFE